jgi:hypothetical protein
MFSAGMCVCLYIYIYIYIYRKRERERVIGNSPVIKMHLRYDGTSVIKFMHVG